VRILPKLRLAGCPNLGLSGRSGCACWMAASANTGHSTRLPPWTKDGYRTSRV